MTNRMTSPPDARKVIVGVDTHKHVHVAVAIDTWGIRLGDQSFVADSGGYQALITWAETHGRLEAFGIEGTGSYGAGLARAGRRAGHRVVEVNRGDRRTRRAAGKSDTVDAEVAARSVLAGQSTAIPKTADGAVEMMRQLKITRDTAVRRCCVNRNWHRALPRVGSSPIDRERLWSTKLGHSIEHVARKHRFDSLRCASPTSKSIAENRLVPEERVLDAGLSMIADLLLPSTAPNLADPSNRPIASARPRVASGQLGCLRRRHDDGRASGVGCLVEGERVVGSVRRDRPRAAGNGLDQIDARTRVIHRGIGQRLSDDHSRLVDSQMKLLPPTPPASSVFRRRPLTLADQRQASAVDEEVQGGAPGNASECEVEMLPAPGQRRVVGRPQVKAHQMEE